MRLGLGSGVVRRDEGVDVFEGSKDGDRDEARTSPDAGSDTAASWDASRLLLFALLALLVVLLPPILIVMLLLLGGMTDMRFSLLVSVGLMVLAPSPVT